jgi:hypothetical protein
MTSALVGMLFLLAAKEPFVADAMAEKELLVGFSEQTVQDLLMDIRFLRRTMPGVVAIEGLPEGEWLYKTERPMPFSDPFRADFILKRFVNQAVTYQTPNPGAPNWMSFRFETSAAGNNQTAIRIRLRVRLMRDDGSAIHLLAPLLGEAFISERMQNDFEEMLDAFASNFLVECGRVGEPAITLTGER